MGGVALAGVGAILLGWTAANELREAARFGPLTLGAAESERVGERVEISLSFGGSFEGYIEPCGCSRFQNGGAVNFGATLEDARSGLPALRALALPALFGGEGEIDRLKNEALVRALEALQPEGIVLGTSDLGFAEPVVRRLLGASVPVLATNLRPRGIDLPRHLAWEVQELPVVVVSAMAAPSPQAAERLGLEVEEPAAAVAAALAPWRERPAVVVLVSGLLPAETARLWAAVPGIDLVLQPELPPVAPAGAADGPPVFAYSGVRRGQHLLTLTLEADPAGRVVSAIPRYQEVRVGRQHAQVEAEVVRFFEQVARLADPRAAPAPRCQGCPEETREGATYAGALACKGCHPAEFEDWDRSAHAHAYTTLANAQRQFVPECLMCHTTGMGRAGGFTLSQGAASALKGVQCEVCHGPGGEHVAQQGRVATRRAPPRSLCEECHSPQRHPGFAGHEAEHWEKILHRRAAPSAAGLAGEGR